MTDDQDPQMVWIPAGCELDEASRPTEDRCKQGDHTWAAHFFLRGRLAFWQCLGCEILDRDGESLTEPLGRISGWIEMPPKLVARGPHPPASAKRWKTAEGTILVEGEPSSTHFIGLAIPGLTAAYDYVELDQQEGTVFKRYEPGRKVLYKYSDFYLLTRFLVVSDELVQFEIRCHKDSTYGTPHANKPKQTIILPGLEALKK